MPRHMKVAFSAFSTAIFLLVMTQSAFAYHLLGGRWPNQPHSGCCARLTAAIVLPMTSYDQTGWWNGMDAWNVSPANIVFSENSGGYAPVMYDTYNSGVGWDGITYIHPCNSCTYTYDDAYLNYYYTVNYSDAEIQSVSAHELGHVLGLDHNTGCVLMNAYTSTRWGTCGVNTPQQDDINGVNAQY